METIVTTHDIGNDINSIFNVWYSLKIVNIHPIRNAHVPNTVMTAGVTECLIPLSTPAGTSYRPQIGSTANIIRILSQAALITSGSFENNPEAFPHHTVSGTNNCTENH